MAEGRGRAEWARTAALLAMIANVNRDPKRRPRPYRPSDFDPYARAPSTRRTTELRDLKAMFTGAKRRRGAKR